MKSLPAGPGLENANLDSGKVRRVALQQRRGAAYPQRKYTRAPTPSSMMFFGNNGADLRTRKQGVSASNTDERSPKQVYTTQEEKVRFGKEEGDGKYVVTGREAAAEVVAGFALTLRSLTDPASSMVKPACIRNTSIAALLMAEKEKTCSV